MSKNKKQVREEKENMDKAREHGKSHTELHRDLLRSVDDKSTMRRKMPQTDMEEAKQKGLNFEGVHREMRAKKQEKARKEFPRDIQRSADDMAIMRKIKEKESRAAMSKAKEKGDTLEKVHGKLADAATRKKEKKDSLHSTMSHMESARTHGDKTMHQVHKQIPGAYSQMQKRGLDSIVENATQNKQKFLAIKNVAETQIEKLAKLFNKMQEIPDLKKYHQALETHLYAFVNAIRRNELDIKPLNELLETSNKAMDEFSKHKDSWITHLCHHINTAIRKFLNWIDQFTKVTERNPSRNQMFKESHLPVQKAQDLLKEFDSAVQHASAEVEQHFQLPKSAKRSIRD